MGVSFGCFSSILFLRLIGKKIISYDSAGGTDQFNNFANITCVKSNFHKDFFINSGGVLPRSHKLQRFIKLRPKKSSVIVTGSILYEEGTRMLDGFIAHEVTDIVSAAVSGDKDAEDIEEISSKADSVGTYSLEYLNPVVKAVGSNAGFIKCEFSSAKPLRIEFKVANIGRIHFYLAPRVES